MTASAPPLALPSLARQGITVDFDGGALASDAGFIPLALAEHQLALPTALAAASAEFRDPDQGQHDVLSLLRLRI